MGTMTAASNMKIIGLIGLVLLCPLASASGTEFVKGAKATIAGVKVKSNGYVSPTVLSSSIVLGELVSVNVPDAPIKKARKIALELMKTDTGKSCLEIIFDDDKFMTGNLVVGGKLTDYKDSDREDAIKIVAYKSGNLTVPASMLKKTRRRLGWKPSHDIPRRHEGFHHSFHPLINRVLR